MAYVVTASCLGDRFTKCVDVCPVDAFREGPQMLYIDPLVCIDCNACLTECPVRAIYPDSAVPEPMQDYIELNARMTKQYPPITESLDVDDSQAGMTAKVPRAAGPARRLARVEGLDATLGVMESRLREFANAEPRSRSAVRL